jgi:hypothetical protein
MQIADCRMQNERRNSNGAGERRVFAAPLAGRLKE